MREANVKGMAHITGGGFYENFPRLLPDGLGVKLNASSWQEPPVFRFLQDIGGIADDEMYRVFNMGIGMAIIVPQEDVDSVMHILNAHGEAAWVIGETVPDEGVHILR